MFTNLNTGLLYVNSANIDVLDRQRRDESVPPHGRSVTEIWGRDEMKNADLWGGGRNKEFGPFGGRNFK